jgi:hypothetical protein
MVPRGSAPVPLFHVKAARADEEYCGPVVQLVRLALGRRVRDIAAVGVVQILLTLYHVIPGRCSGVFKISHEDTRTRVEGVDDHFAVGWPRDLHPAVLKFVWSRRNAPCRMAGRLGVGEEIWKDSFVKLCLTDLAPVQHILPFGLES